MSFSFFLHIFPRHDALKLGKDFAKQTNCSVSDFVCLLSLTPQAILAAQMKTSRTPQTPDLEQHSLLPTYYIRKQDIVYLSANDCEKHVHSEILVNKIIMTEQ